MLSLVLSFVLYGHVLNTIQSIGLLLAVIAMIANFYDKGGKKGGHGHGGGHTDTDSSKDENVSQTGGGIEMGAGGGKPEDELPLMIDEESSNNVAQPETSDLIDLKGPNTV